MLQTAAICAVTDKYREDRALHILRPFHIQKLKRPLLGISIHFAGSMMGTIKLQVWSQYAPDCDSACGSTAENLICMKQASELTLRALGLI